MFQIDATRPTSEDRHYLLVEGHGQVAEGERVKLSVGESVVLGRSRRCDFSLKKTPAFVRDRDGARSRIRASLSYRATSRRHVRLTYLEPDVVEIEDLSRNGTYLDGRRVRRARLEDVRWATHELRLGPNGDLVLLRPGSIPV